MRLIILGAGSYGHTVADVAQQSGKYSSIQFLDDNSATEGVVGPCADYRKYIDIDTEIYPAFGNNQGRLNWVEKLLSDGAKVPTFVHPTSYVSPTVELGVGTVVLPKALVNTDTVVGKACIINGGAIIDHGCVIEDGVHICLGAIVKGENRIVALTKIEAGEVIAARSLI